MDHGLSVKPSKIICSLPLGLLYLLFYGTTCFSDRWNATGEYFKVKLPLYSFWTFQKWNKSHLYVIPRYSGTWYILLCVHTWICLRSKEGLILYHLLCLFCHQALVYWHNLKNSRSDLSISFDFYASSGNAMHAVSCQLLAAVVWHPTTSTCTQFLIPR